MYYVQLMIWLEQVLVSVEKVVMYVAAEHYRAVGRSENLGGTGRTGGHLAMLIPVVEFFG